MRLYLVQHGEAASKDVDPERPLTDNGAADIRKLAGWLERCDARVARILHSGKLRAQQTAEILTPLLIRGDTVEASPGLSPNDPPGTLLESLGGDDVLIAGHMPFVSRAVSLALELSPDRPVVAYQPGSLAILERDDTGTWRLIAFVRPEQL